MMASSVMSSKARPWLASVLPNRWLTPGNWKVVALVLAACLSWPSAFSAPPTIGLDPSWGFSLELATLAGKTFGKQFVFTYGPLGFLQLHIPADKLALLLYDSFVAGSLVYVYYRLLSAGSTFADVITVLGLACVTKLCLNTGAAAVLFSLLCFWLWQLWRPGGMLALCCCLIAATVLAFGKVNYGLVTMVAVPAYGLALAVLIKERRICGMVLCGGFLCLLGIGCSILHVALPDYFRAGLEFIGAYGEAMATPPAGLLLSWELASVFLVALGTMALFGKRLSSWKDWALVVPLLGLALALSFKNSFVRADDAHTISFHQGLPLLLAAWCIAWNRQRLIVLLLSLSLLFPLAQLIGTTRYFGRYELGGLLPIRYGRQAWATPWRENPTQLSQALRKRHPEAVFSDTVVAQIGDATIDVMPWESSVAILNRLSLKQRPIPQSYSVYTARLDELNAAFISSSEAAEFILYTCAQDVAIDGRPSAWDESATKRAILENYTLVSESEVALRVWPTQELESAPVFLLHRRPNYRRLELVGSKELDVFLDQPITFPSTENLLFLKMEAERTIAGKLKALVMWPSLLMTTMNYAGGEAKAFRAVVPLLKSGVLVNRRVESVDDTRGWLTSAAISNPVISSISFTSAEPSAFRVPFKAKLEEYRVIVDGKATADLPLRPSIKWSASVIATQP